MRRAATSTSPPRTATSGTSHRRTAATHITPERAGTLPAARSTGGWSTRSGRLARRRPAVHVVGLPGRQLPQAQGHAHRPRAGEPPGGRAADVVADRPQRPQGHSSRPTTPRCSSRSAPTRRLVTEAGHRPRASAPAARAGRPGSPSWPTRGADAAPRASCAAWPSATRRVMHGMVMTDADEATRWPRRPTCSRRWPTTCIAAPSPGAPSTRASARRPRAATRHGFFDHSPMLGRGQPDRAADLAARPRRAHDGRARRRSARAYEGPPGCVHGGFIAAAFDEVLGAVQSLSGSRA